MAEQNNDGSAHDISVRAVRWGALAILGGILFALAAAYGAWRLFGPEASAGHFAAPAPLLQSAPQPERAAYFADKEQRIGSYGWVDRKAGIARIPVEQAMQLMAGQGRTGR